MWDEGERRRAWWLVRATHSGQLCHLLGLTDNKLLVRPAVLIKEGGRASRVNIISCNTFTAGSWWDKNIIIIINTRFLFSSVCICVLVTVDLRRGPHRARCWFLAEKKRKKKFFDYQPKLTFSFRNFLFCFCFVFLFDGFITNPAALREGKRGWGSIDAPISHEDRVGTLSGSSSALAGLRCRMRGRRRRSRTATSTTSAFKAPLPESTPRQRRSRWEQRRLHGHEPAGWQGSSRRKRENAGNAHGTAGT